MTGTRLLPTCHGSSTTYDINASFNCSLGLSLPQWRFEIDLELCQYGVLPDFRFFVFDLVSS